MGGAGIPGDLWGGDEATEDRGSDTHKDEAMNDPNDAQTIIRSQVDHYLDTHLIEDLSIHTHLIEVTAAGDENKSYIPTGRVTVTIDLANR